MNKILFVINPVAGRNSAKKILPLIQNEITNQKIEAKIEFTKYPGHAIEITKKAVNNFNRIISVGGDGTLNEVINGIELNSDVQVGILPTGTGNDFILNLGMKKNITNNIKLMLSKNPNIIKSDIGELDYYETGYERVKQRRFINCLGIGFDAYVAYINQKNKYFSGILSYIYALSKALFKLEQININALFNDEIIKGEKLLLAIGNGKTSGGGFYLNPTAKINDNFLDLTVIDSLSKVKILTKLPLALINKLEKADEVVMHKFKELEVKLNNPYFIHADGEILTKKVKKINLRCIGSALNFISV